VVFEVKLLFSYLVIHIFLFIIQNLKKHKQTGFQPTMGYFSVLAFLFSLLSIASSSSVVLDFEDNIWNDTIMSRSSPSDVFLLNGTLWIYQTVSDNPGNAKFLLDALFPNASGFEYHIYDI